MKTWLGSFLWVSMLVLSLAAHADENPARSNPKSSKALGRHAEGKPSLQGPTPAAPTCKPSYAGKKINLVSWDPQQKAGKILGSIQECKTDMYEVLRLLSGPNTIGLSYPEEKERWGYIWLWSYELKNPIEETVILMDNPGKRIKKGKNPVELYITFNEHDIVERVELDLIKKKNNQYVIFP